jgi:hypothetical protein
MKEIPLTQGYVAIVDDQDFEVVNRHNWHARRNGNTAYAITNIGKGAARTSMFMHRLILGLSDPKVIVDHKNGCGVDNRRENIRICTPAENARNTRHFRGESLYKGVKRGSSKRRWLARIMVNGERIDLGYFDTEEQAALAYNMAAKLYFGEFACLNDVPPGTKMPDEYGRSARSNNKAGYRGVHRDGVGGKPWVAAITVKGCEITIGRFKTPEEAARAHDFVALKLKGEKAKLNFRDSVNMTEADAPKYKAEPLGACGYFGVYKDCKHYAAYISIDAKRVRIGVFRTAEDAARARDAAIVKHYGDGARLNFPGEQPIEVQPLDIKPKFTTDYLGVYARRDGRKFFVNFTVKGKQIYLGHFDTVEEAARARDAKVKELGLTVRLNFPDWRRANPATPPATDRQ